MLQASSERFWDGVKQVGITMCWLLGFEWICVIYRLDVCCFVRKADGVGVYKMCICKTLSYQCVMLEWMSMRMMIIYRI